MRPLALVAALTLLGTTLARGQDNEAAGLFTEARHLPVVSQSIVARVVGGEAELRLIQVFINDGDALGQADYHLYVPQGATVTAFGFWNEGTFLAAALKEKAEAEARHRQAAREERATGLLRQENRIHSFSVYPVGAGELKKIETTFRVPVEREMGRSHLAVPVDAFLGQPGPPTSIVVDLSGEEPLADFGAEGAKATLLSREDRRLRLGFTTRRPAQVWWSESGPALQASAELVPLEEGDLALHVRVAFNDAAGSARAYGRVHLLLDGSHSMRRREASVRALLERVRKGAKAPVEVHLVGQREVPFPAGASVDDVVAALRAGRAGHTATWARFAAAAERLGCGAAPVRCSIVTDAQLEGLERTLNAAASLVLLADPHELAFLGERRPEGAAAYVPGADPEARLLELADELVLPVLTADGVLQDGEPRTFPGWPRLRVAEGGLLRLFARTASAGAVTLVARIDGQERKLELVPVPLEADSERGRAVRRGVYRELLADWMDSYAKEADEDLKRHIVEVSLREGIPTAFTALQVDDPRLSMASIKPGDPLLTVRAEPGLREVVAWYPFGEMRALVRDAGRQAFVDRFLVPRGWAEGAYAVDVFKYYEDGAVRRAKVWYQLDERGPQATLRYDAAARRLRIETGAATREVSTVSVHTTAGRVLSLTPLGGDWVVAAAELTPRFTVVLRDAAGNRTVIDCRLQGDDLQVLAAPGGEGARAAAVAPQALALAGPSSSGPLSIEGNTVLVRLEGRVLRVPAVDVGLRSLDLRAVARRGEEIVLGTVAGDLVALRCTPEGSCRGRRLTEALVNHPIVGLAPSGDALLVGALGRGLFELKGELKGEALGRSRLRMASRFVTGLVAWGGSVYVGTANDGLWVLRRGRLVRARFPHDHVARLEAGRNGLEITSGFGRYRLAGGRLLRRDDGTGVLPRGSERLTASVEWMGTTYVGSFDRGLFVMTAEGLRPVDLGLDAVEGHVNVLTVAGGSLWMGTEGGLLQVSAPQASGVRRILPAAVHGLAGGPDGLAVATSQGLHVVSGEAARRLDGQDGPAARSFTSVAWWDGALFAGGLDGLYRFQGRTGRQLSAAEGFRAGWVTALLPTANGLLVGTYDAGVHVLLKGGRMEAMRGLEDQWVPPNGLQAVGSEVWVGGVGMPPVRLAGGAAVRQAVPAGDVYAVHAHRADRLLLTSEGWLQAGK